MTKFMLMAAAAFALPASVGQAAVLYDNGPVVEASGLSIINPGGTLFGAGAQISASNAVADDFTVTGAWNVTSLDFFSYQTSESGFTFTNVIWSIVSGDVNAGAVVASGTTALTNGGLMGYRVTAATLGDQTRDIYRLSADVADFNLDAGHYFLRWSLGGIGASGPWAPPVASAYGAGNAAQSIANGAFSGLIDAGSGQNVELPFAINGTMAAIPEPGSWAMMIGGLALVGASMRRRTVKLSFV